MKNNFKKKVLLKALLLSFLSVLFLASCSNDDEPVKDDDVEIIDDTPSSTSNYYKVLRAENFGYTLADGNELEDKAVLYYSLVDNKAVGSEYRKTSRWDLGFSGLYSSFLSGNNGANTGNLGSGNSAIGGIYIVEQAFDEVVNVPNDAVFKTGDRIYGTDDAGDFGGGVGWYLYDFDGIFVRDGAYDNAHIAYALGEPLLLKSGNTVPARTLIVKTAKGDYAKIKMISVYKDILKREDYTRKSPKMFFTFEYVLVPKGSTKFEIKK
ncbi:HmuY family protein [Flavobacterium pectinovorum]|uniref:HmuY family protein n=1 Tax=Flavobacterium pectinovorum TaxID=29533 RepID=UPI001FAE355E|nr:HmuY family protein [Flavobacterium pectinovorum]MCI9843381.1 HmuY family protein [Flavobacterium pectinovorum]